MHAFLDTPFETLRWTSQDLVDAVPLRLHEIDLFDAAASHAASANAARFQREPRLRNAYLAAAALPARFGIR